MDPAAASKTTAALGLMETQEQRDVKDHHDGVPGSKAAISDLPPHDKQITVHSNADLSENLL